jgi:ATP-dependent Clp protease adaptor protein ClpS
MPAAPAQLEPDTTVDSPDSAPDADADSNTRPRRQPPYSVILHNDDLNTFPFVVAVLQKVFGYARPRAFELTMTAHATGRSVVWTGPLETAELKADQIRSCGPDPDAADKGAGPLGVTIEPAAG